MKSWRMTQAQVDVQIVTARLSGVPAKAKATGECWYGKLIFVDPLEAQLKWLAQAWLSDGTLVSLATIKTLDDLSTDNGLRRLEVVRR